MNRVFLWLSGLLIVGLGSWGWVRMNQLRVPGPLPAGTVPPGGRRLVKSDWDWHKQLTGSQFSVTRQGGTEWAFSSPLNHNHRPGLYRCVCCHSPLFSSVAKFDSGTGWPSFSTPIVSNAVYERTDGRRTEVRCTVCDAHLGHVFRDGPAPTGLRYCMNGVALAFAPSGK